MIRAGVLLFLVILPGVGVTSLSTYYLLPEWATLDASFQNYQRVAKAPSSTLSDLFIAEAAQNRHRINCFAEGMGVLLGLTIAGIGVHGICTLPRST